MGVIAPKTASAVTYNISWFGSNGYALFGQFSYDDSIIGTGIVNESVIETFAIEGFHNGVSLGSWNLADGSDSAYLFNFNFNSTTEQFIVGGISSSATGQAWNRRATGIGFESGDNHQVLTLNGIALDQHWMPINSQIDTALSTLTAAAVVPVPAALYLFASGLLGLFGISRTKSHKGRS